jgi:putative hydrolase of the HAD superfamily
LIAFDLDDTLIETSRIIAPAMLKKTLHDLELAGLSVEDQDLDKLYAINNAASGSLEALSLFLQKKSLSEEKRSFFFEIAKKSMRSSLPQEISILTALGAFDLLEKLQKDHVLTLVTRGSYDYQMEKIRKAGMDRGFFRKIVVLEESEKGRVYQELAEEFGFFDRPREVLVIGDRYEVDLAPAKKLGYWTILRMNGRALISQGPYKKYFIEKDRNKQDFGNIVEIEHQTEQKDEDVCPVIDLVDYRVKDLLEVLEIVETIQTMTKTKQVEKLC